MVRFLNGLFERKGNSPSEASARAAGAALAVAGMPLSGAVGQWDMEQAVTRGLERVGMVFRCVDAIAATQARIPMQLVKIDPRRSRSDAEVIEDEDIWKLLNFRANSYESSQQFRYRVTATLLLSRRGAFIEMVPGKGGKPGELHLLMPGRVQPVPDAKKFVSRYEIMRGDSVIDSLPPERVCWIKVKPHPSDPYSQLTPLMAAGIAAETDFLARSFNRNFLAQDGRPGMLVTIKGHLNREDADEIKSRFSGGISQAGRTSVVEAEGLDVADMAASPRDLQWSELITGSKEDIQLAFGVPESVMGNASGRTYDNADAERENFYIDTIQPHCDALAMGLDPITGKSDDMTVVSYDFSGVDVLQRMAARKREEYRSEFGSGLITIDEYRELSGRPPFDVVASRVLFTGLGLAVAKTPQDQEEASKLTPIGSGGGGLQGEAAAEAGALKGSRKGAAEAARALGNTMSAQSVANRARMMSKSMGGEELERKGGLTGDATFPGSQSWEEVAEESPHPYLSTRHTMEGFVEGQLTQWDVRQGEVVADRLGHVKSRKGTRHWQGEGSTPGEVKGKGFPKNQKCKYCTEAATKRILHSEGMAYIPVCDEHLSKGKDAAAKCVPSGGPDPSNIVGIRDVKSGEGNPHETVEYKDLDPSYAMDEARWTQELVNGLGGYVRKAMVREARRVAVDMKRQGLDGVPGVDLSGRDPLVSLFGGKVKVQDALDPAHKAVVDIIRTAAQNQSARVKETIARMDKEGASLQDIEHEVRAMTSSRAPWRKALAINVTTTAVEAARSAVYEKVPAVLFTKTWRSMHDARVRPSHAKANGQRRQINKPFLVGGVKMMYPGVPGAPIHEVANCRCYAQYDLSSPGEKKLKGMK